MKPFLIGEDWVSTGPAREALDPFTQKSFEAYHEASADDLERAIQVANEAFAANRKIPPSSRVAFLDRIGVLIRERAAELCELIVTEAGKPITAAKAEVARATETFAFAASECRQARGELLATDSSSFGAGHFGFVEYKPLGVIFGITPFNFPLNLVAHKVAPALAAGNAIIIKPSPRTALTALKLGEIVLEAGTPPGLVNIVPCSVDAMAAAYNHPRIQMISFTGSAAIGWQIKEKASRQRVTLELGGNAALIVHHDAKWETKIPAVAQGAFGYSGQSCISIQRIFVHQRIYDMFRNTLSAYVRAKVRTGNPREDDVLVGPMITQEAADKVGKWVDEAIAAGATALVAKKIDGQTMSPTILENVPGNLPISCEEAFAPVVVLESYEDFGEAVRQVNRSKFGIHAGVFTRDLALAQQAYEDLEVGGVLINQVPTFRLENMPYGGVKESGSGREGIRYAMQEMSEPKAFLVNLQ